MKANCARYALEVAKECMTILVALNVMALDYLVTNRRDGYEPTG